MANQPHHRDRRYVLASKRIRDAANANPRAICCICRRTRAEHVTERPSGDNTWHACHTIDRSRTWQPWLDVTTPPPPGDWLAAGIARCNISAGNDARDARHRTGYTWP